MADNLFKDSDPNCGVPEVPVVDFKFVDDCFIPPTPPPIFECFPVTVPNEPCISCPTFDPGGTINVGYPGPGENCPTEPRIEVKVEKKSDACEYDLTVDLDIPIPRPPCPKINVNTFEVQTRFNSPGCCSAYETDVNVDTFDEIDTLTSETTPPKTIVRVRYANATNIITVDTIEDRNALLESGAPELTETTVVKVLQPEVTTWKLTTFVDGDVGYLTWMATGLDDFAKYYINDGTAENTNWRELVSENSAEVCENTFTVTPRHRDPVDCNDPGECEFDIELEIYIPIPRTPCPKINITDFEVNTHFDPPVGDAQCCIERDYFIAVGEVATIADRNELSFAVVPQGGYAKTTIDIINGVPVAAEHYWQRASDVARDEWTETEDPNAPICGSRFKITPRHRTPENCQDPGQCEFDIELFIDVPIPRIPCPTITGVVDVVSGYDDSPCVGCVADMTVKDKAALNAIPEEEREEGMYVKVEDAVSSLVWDGEQWVDGATDNTSEPDVTAANWQAVIALGVPEDGTVVEVTNAPTEFIIGEVAITSGGKYVYDWQPLYDGISGSSRTFNSIVDRDAAYRNKYVGYHSVTVRLLNPPTRYRYETNRANGQLMAGWVGLNTSNDTPEGQVVKDETEARAIDSAKLTPGTVVTLDNPTNRYKYENGQWVAAPCPKNGFRITTKHRDPGNCNDPGECEFDIGVDIVVPIPRTPCPEINITTFTVDVKDKDCVAEKEAECAKATPVDDIAARDALISPDAADQPKAGALVFVKSENKTYRYTPTSPNKWTETQASQAGDCCTSRFSITTRHEDNKVRKILNSEAELQDPEAIGDIESEQVVAVKKQVTGQAESSEDLPTGVAPGAVYSTPGAGGKTKYWEKQADGSWAPTSSKKFFRRGTKTKDKPGKLSWQEISLNDDGCDNGPEKCIFDIDLNLCIQVPVPCPKVNGKNKTNVGYAGSPCVSCDSNETIANKDGLQGSDTGPTPPKKDCNPRDGEDDDYKNDYYVSTRQVQARFVRSGNEFVPTGYTIPVNRPGDITAIPPGELIGTSITLTDPPKFWQKHNGTWGPVYPTKPGFIIDSQSDLSALPTDKFPPGSVVGVKGGGQFERLPAGGWKELPNYNDLPAVGAVSDLEDVEAAEGDVIHVTDPTATYTLGPFGQLIPDEREVDWYVFEESDLDELNTGDNSPVPDGGLVEVVFPTDRWQLVRAEGNDGPLYSWVPARCPKNEFKVVTQKKKADDCSGESECIFHFFTEITVPIPVPPCPVFNSNVKARTFYENCSTCKADIELETIADLTAIGPIGQGPDKIEECEDLPEDPGIPEGTTASVTANNTRWRWLTQYGGWWPAKCESEMYIISKKTFDNGSCDKPPACEFDVVVDINVPIPPPPCPIFNIKNSEVNVCYAAAPNAQIAINQRKRTTCKEDQNDDEKTCDDEGCIFDFDFKLDIPCPIFLPGGIAVNPVPPNHPGGFGGAGIIARNDCFEVPPVYQCPDANYTVQDIRQRNKKIVELAITNNPNLAPGVVASVAISNPPGTSYYSFQGGAECGDSSWRKMSVDPDGPPPDAQHATSSANASGVNAALAEVVAQQIAQSSNSLIGTVIKTIEPEPKGSYWEYLGGLESGDPLWNLITCQDEPSQICAFDFNAVINVPFCEPKMLEDDEQGTHTGIEKAVRHRVYHIKPDETCPIGKDPLDLAHPVLAGMFAPCPDGGEQLDDINDMFARVGKMPGNVEWRKQGPDGEVVVNIPIARGLRFVTQPPDPNGPEKQPYYLVSAGNGFTQQQPRNPRLPLTVVEREMPVAGLIGLPILDLADVNANLGEAPQIQNGQIFKIKNGGRFQVQILNPITRQPDAGAEFDPFLQNVRWVQLQCAEEQIRLVVQPDKVAPCTLRYCVVSRICQRHADHVAKCTEYFGDPCCDTGGCPCDKPPATCCDDAEKEDYKDGSEDSGIPYYGIAAPTQAQNFTARPWLIGATTDIPEDPVDFNSQPLTPAARPVLPIAENPDAARPVMRTTTVNNPDVPAEDACAKKSTTDGEDCEAFPQPTDKGYRPYKSLELRIKEEYDEKRLKPPTVSYNLEAALNCLHGGKVKVKKGTRGASGGTGGTPTSPLQAPGEMQPVNNPVLFDTGGTGTSTTGDPSTPCDQPADIGADDLGWGCIRIENNRVNLDITLFAETCEEASTSTGGGGTTGLPMLAASTAPTELTPVLLESFIRAINTNPELKAAIRNIVNQPDT